MAYAHKKMDFRILAFGIVGSIGFAVDASVLTLLTISMKMDILPARSISFTCATLVTWVLNRAFTFSRQAAREPVKRRKEYFSYITVQIVGAALNLIVFLAVVKWRPSMQLIPAIPLAIGAVVGLIFNFIMSRKFVFLEHGEMDE